MCNAVEQAKEEVMWGVRSMVEKGYALGTAGNISARVKGEELFVITPSSRSYTTLTKEDLCLLDMSGKVIEGKYKPSVEAVMHRYIFQIRPEVEAIVHSHSKYGTLASSIKGVAELPIIDVESISYLGGEVPVAPFAPRRFSRTCRKCKSSYWDKRRSTYGESRHDRSRDHDGKSNDCQR